MQRQILTGWISGRLIISRLSYLLAQFHIRIQDPISSMPGEHEAYRFSYNSLRRTHLHHGLLSLELESGLSKQRVDECCESEYCRSRCDLTKQAPGLSD